MSTLLILPLFAVMIYFVAIRPQQQLKKQEPALQAALDIGDEIVTKSGLYGMITEFDGGTVFLEVADGVELKVSRDAIGSRVFYDEPADEPTDDDEADA